MIFPSVPAVTSAVRLRSTEVIGSNYSPQSRSLTIDHEAHVAVSDTLIRRKPEAKTVPGLPGRCGEGAPETKRWHLKWLICVDICVQIC